MDESRRDLLRSMTGPRFLRTLGRLAGRSIAPFSSVRTALNGTPDEAGLALGGRRPASKLPRFSIPQGPAERAEGSPRRFAARRTDAPGERQDASAPPDREAAGPTGSPAANHLENNSETD